jgi:hypothetical protein
VQNLSFDFVTESEYIEEEGLLPNQFTTETVHGPQQVCVFKWVKKGMRNKIILLLLIIHKIV